MPNFIERPGVLIVGLLALCGLLGWGWVNSFQQNQSLQLTVDKQAHILSEMSVTDVETVKEVTETKANVDGSRVIRKEKISTVNKSEIKRIDSNTKEHSNIKIAPKISKYSLGLQYPMKRDSILKPDWHEIRIEGGVRLGDSPVHIIVGHNLLINDSTFTLGLRLDF